MFGPQPVIGFISSERHQRRHHDAGGKNEIERGTYAANTVAANTGANKASVHRACQTKSVDMA